MRSATRALLATTSSLLVVGGGVLSPRLGAAFVRDTFGFGLLGALVTAPVVACLVGAGTAGVLVATRMGGRAPPIGSLLVSILALSASLDIAWVSWRAAVHARGPLASMCHRVSDLVRSAPPVHSAWSFGLQAVMVVATAVIAIGARGRERWLAAMTLGVVAIGVALAAVGARC